MKTLFALIALLVSFTALTMFAADDTAKDEFATTTIDIGCVVSDIDASIKFYTEAIGFTPAGGFQVDADFATESGLTDQKSLDVKVLTLGEGPGTTKLKLMQIRDSGKKAPNDFIDSTLGFSYITIVVNSTDDAMARLKKAGVKPIAKGPATLPANIDEKMALTIVRDPDGNLIELVGPKPSK